MRVDASTSPERPAKEAGRDPRKRPRRSIYYLRQAINSLLYIFLVLLLLLLALIWTVVITFTVVPIILWRRGYRKVPEYYTAPFELQRDLFHSFRFALRKGKSEWDFEKGKPQPVALLERGFKSQLGNLTTQPDSTLLLKLPPELRLKIYEQVILGESTLFRVIIHRRKGPGERRPRCTFRGIPTGDHVSEIPYMDCNCFNLRQYGRGPQKCEASWPGYPRRGLLALPLTCRQLYMESINLLYSQ